MKPDIAPALLAAYQFHRGRTLRTPAQHALNLARLDLDAGRKRYGASLRAVVFNPRLAAFGNRHARWIENAADGLRLVDFADKIDRGIQHTGWYTMDDCDGETLRGIVYRLPTRKGAPRFAYGYADPCNEGAAFLSFDHADSEQDAARWADQLAERAAEEERDHNRAWGAGRQFEELGEEASAARKAALALIKAIKVKRRELCDAAPIVDALRAQLERLQRTIRAARDKRAELLTDFGNQSGFNE